MIPGRTDTADHAETYASSLLNQPLLRVENLKVSFTTEYGVLHAVDGVSLTVERGQTVGIVGESGSGKTVFSRSLMGLLPRTAAITANAIRFEGRNLLELRARELRRIRGREIAYIFQDPMTSLNPVMTVGLQISEMLTRHLGKNRREAAERAEALLASVGIPSPARRLKEYPHQLSGGMRQRVVIAMALSCEPKLLIADEPTTALDVTVQSQILDLLQRYQQEHHMAMLLISHDLGVVAGRTDEIAVMYAGKVVEQAPTAALFKRMRMPYTEALLNSIPRIEDEPHKRLEAIRGRPPNLIRLPPGCAFHPRCVYVRERCRTDAPPLREENGHGHRFACWYPVESGVPVTTAKGKRSAKAQKR